jgi:predicted negative regulator of RcsB-dependent stress response
MMKKRLQNGFAHPVLILLLLIVVAVALIGYRVEQNHNKASVASAGSGTPTVSQTAQAIQSKADLNSAENSLNSQNIDGDLNPSQYNQDVNSLL